MAIKYGVLLYFLSLFMGCSAQTMLEELYCGKQNCYEVIGVKREATKNKITREYRKMARKVHPDLFRDTNDKLVAEEQFKKLANAYGILKDEESRNDYDYMLDHPDEFYSHYYRYYRRRVAPKVDVRIVIAVTITVISAIQYFTSWQRYDSAINYLLTVPKYRMRALEVAKEKGLLDNKKKTRGKCKTEIKEETDAIIRKVLEDNMDIRGGYAKPKITDILWVQIVALPYTITAYCIWYAVWIWKFNVHREPFGDEQKLYLIRKFMNIGLSQFDAIDESEKQQYLKHNLWMKEKYQEWQVKKEEDVKKQMAESARYKAYRRYMKQHGTGRITFNDS